MLAVCCRVQGIKFTDNIIADPDLASACTGASLLVFVLPHQFLGRICPQVRDGPTLKRARLEFSAAGSGRRAARRNHGVCRG